MHVWLIVRTIECLPPKQLRTGLCVAETALCSWDSKCVLIREVLYAILARTAGVCVLFREVSLAQTVCASK